MSLTSQLARGELGRWFQHRMPGTASVAEEVCTAASRVSPVRPARGTQIGPRHWAEVGGTFGARHVDCTFRES